MTLRGTYTYMGYIYIYVCAYIVAITARWLCMSLLICIVLRLCSSAPCAGTMQLYVLFTVLQFCCMGRSGGRVVARACCVTSGCVTSEPTGKLSVVVVTTH